MIFSNKGEEKSFVLININFDSIIMLLLLLCCYYVVVRYFMYFMYKIAILQNVNSFFYKCEIICYWLENKNSKSNIL